MAIEFTKMQGIGNDFVVIDAITQRVELDNAAIARLGDRHTGIGFDQLLLVETPDDPDADFRFRIHNSDGSPAGQCGNGARCFARFVLDRGLTVKTRLVLQTGDGRIVCEVHDDRVDVDMGEPGFDPAVVPFDASTAATPVADDGSVELEVEGRRVRCTPVSMGNPHAVLFVDDIATAPVATLGPAIQRHPAFPAGVNVGFCEVVDAGFMRLRVHERGAGETLACGSGACAAAAAAIRAGRTGERVKVSLPGGKLRVSWQGPGHAIRMSGPTAVVFEGRIEP